MIKLIASDMDGTLLDSRHKISEENIKAIKKAQQLGVHFTIITGRDYNSVKPFVENLGLNCEYIVLSGAEYRNKDGEIIFSISMDKNKAKRIMVVMNKEGLDFEVFTNNGVYTSNKESYEKRISDVIKVNKLDISLEEVLKYKKIFESVEEIKNIDEFIKTNINIYRICTFDKSVEIIEKVKNELEIIEGLAVSGTFFNDIEVNDSEAQKGLILAKVIEKMGIKRDEVIVLGDSFNDYSLFTEFENSFAMENAIPEIKAVAKNITDSNENSGVAKAIYKALNI